MSRGIAILSGLLLLMCVGVISVVAAPTTPPPGTPAKPPSAPPDDYILGAGDSIEVNVFGEPDLSRTVTIKPDGVVALPLINQVKASGKTAAQLEAELTKLYGKYLRAPSVSIIVRQFRMHRVYVMGEVTKPGRYDITDDMNVLDALTSAGGVTDKANLDAVQLSRVENGKSKAIPIKMSQVVQGKDPGQNMKLQNGDLLYVPRRGMTILEILQSILSLRGILPF
jgi:polysaccharide biosynthesis/export protein